MGVPQQCMVYNLKTPIKMDDLGWPYFRKLTADLRNVSLGVTGSQFSTTWGVPLKLGFNQPSILFGTPSESTIYGWYTILFGTCDPKRGLWNKKSVCMCLLPSGKLTSLWKITIFYVKIHYKRPFSVAMLVRTRWYTSVQHQHPGLAARSDEKDWAALPSNWRTFSRWTAWMPWPPSLGDQRSLDSIEEKQRPGLITTGANSLGNNGWK